MRQRRRQFVPLLVAALCAPWAAGCHRDMYDQARVDPLEASTFFADGRSARPLVEGTVPRGALDEDEAFATGRSGGKPLREIPVAVDRALLQRGRERFNIYCSVCHGRSGEGDGTIVRRGFRRPPSYHTAKLRGAPVGHFFDVVAHGFGAMPAFAAEVPPRDRWAIAAYIRALQLSQYATPEDLTPEELQKLETAAGDEVAAGLVPAGSADDPETHPEDAP